MNSGGADKKSVSSNPGQVEKSTEHADYVSLLRDLGLSVSMVPIRRVIRTNVNCPSEFRVPGINQPEHLVSVSRDMLNDARVEYTSSLRIQHPNDWEPIAVFVNSEHVGDDWEDTAYETIQSSGFVPRCVGDSVVGTQMHVFGGVRGCGRIVMALEDVIHIPVFISRYRVISQFFIDQDPGYFSLKRIERAIKFAEGTPYGVHPNAIFPNGTSKYAIGRDCYTYSAQEDLYHLTPQSNVVTTSIAFENRSGMKAHFFVRPGYLSSATLNSVERVPRFLIGVHLLAEYVARGMWYPSPKGRERDFTLSQPTVTINRLFCDERKVLHGGFTKDDHSAIAFQIVGHRGTPFGVFASRRSEVRIASKRGWRPRYLVISNYERQWTSRFVKAEGSTVCATYRRWMQRQNTRIPEIYGYGSKSEDETEFSRLTNVSYAEIRDAARDELAYLRDRRDQLLRFPKVIEDLVLSFLGSGPRIFLKGMKLFVDFERFLETVVDTADYCCKNSETMNDRPFYDLK